MTAIYVGNATRQTYEFAFRAPVAMPKADGLPLRMHKIEPGTFMKIPGEWSPEEADSIIAQHVPYGIIRDNEIDHARALHGIVYSLDKPIVRAKLHYLMESNLGHLVAMGQEIRKANAIAQSDLIQQSLVENGRTERVEAFDTTVQQEQEDPRNDVPQLSVGTLVKRTGGSGPRSQGRAARRRAA